MKIQLNDISFSYQDGKGKRNIFKDFSINVNDGELLMILGPSGCGKTTLLNIMGGLLQPENGQVEYDETSYYDLSKKKRDEFRRNNIGFVFQNFYLVEDLSPMDNVLLAMAGKMSMKEKKDKIIGILEELKIADKLQSNINSFSGGEQQRLAIARAIASDCGVLICDEPTGSLDEENAIQIMDILKMLSEKGKTVVVVTHNKELCKYATNVLELTRKIRIGGNDDATDNSYSD